MLTVQHMPMPPIFDFDKVTSHIQPLIGATALIDYMSAAGMTGDRIALYPKAVMDYAQKN